MPDDDLKTAVPQASEAASPERNTEQAAAQTGQSDQPITLETIMQEVKKTILPLVESRVAKSEKNTDKRIRERFAALEETKGALNLSDDQVAAARQKIISDEYSRQETEEPPAAAQRPDTDDIPAEWVPALNYMTERGVIIAESDKEYGEFLEPVLRDPKATPAGIVLAMDKAINAKTERTNLQREKADIRAPLGGGTPPGQPPVKSAREFLQRAHKE